MEGVYAAPKEAIDFFKAEVQKRHKIQGDYIHADDHANTSKDLVGTVNNRTLIKTVGNVGKDTEELLVNKRSAPMTNNTKKQPVKKGKNKQYIASLTKNNGYRLVYRYNFQRSE